MFYHEFGWLGQNINNGIAQNMDADKSGSLFGSLAYGDFILEGAFNHREKVNPTAQYNLTTFNDSHPDLDRRMTSAITAEHASSYLPEVGERLLA